MICLKPKTVKEYAEALSAATEQSRILSGGTDYVIRQRREEKEPDLIIYPGGIPSLHEIVLDEQELRVGAMAAMAKVAERLAAEPEFSAIVDMASNVGSPQIRNKATIAGNLANASPAGDSLPVCWMYRAEVEMLDGSGACRRIPIDEFLLEPKKTVLGAGQAITAIIFHRDMLRGAISAFCKVGFRSYVSIARESIGVLAWPDEEGNIAELHAVLGAVSGTPIIVPELSNQLRGLHPADAEAFRRMQPLVAAAVKEHCRPKNRLYKTEAAKGLTADVLELIANRWGKE